MRRRLILSDVFPAASGWIMNMRVDGALCLEQIGPCGPIKSRWHPSTREGKATHCILSRLRLLTNAVRCAPLARSPRSRPVDKRKAL